MKQAVFVAGLRTPFTQANKGAYKDVRPDELLTMLFRKQIVRFSNFIGENAADLIEDVIVGCAYPEGEQGYNVARMAALGAGLECTGVTVNRLCGSSLEAVAIASARINAGHGEMFLLGGVESMSRIPRRGANFSESEMIRDKAPHAYITMGETAESVARATRITREEQELFAARSHELAFQAAGKLSQNVYGYLTDRDESVRYPVDANKMASLSPAFSPDGSVTAATSSPLNDGATSGWIMSAERARSFGITEGLVIRDVAWGHVSPELMGLGPVPATKKLLAKNGLNINDIDVVEINEAFAVQVLACQKQLEIPMEKLNSWGGAIALGHPLGASGLRLLMTLEGRMRELNKKQPLGIATLCVGGGQGISLLAEYCELAPTSVPK